MSSLFRVYGFVTWASFVCLSLFQLFLMLVPEWILTPILGELPETRRLLATFNVIGGVSYYFVFSSYGFYVLKNFPTLDDSRTLEDNYQRPLKQDSTSFGDLPKHEWSRRLVRMAEQEVRT